MKDRYLPWCLVLAGLGLWLFLRQRTPESRPDEIEYQGQRFKLTKAYTNYDDYKQDPDNIDPSENARVEQAVVGAKVARQYASDLQMILAVTSIQFPGYGYTSFGAKPQPDGSALTGFAVEIPRANKDRILMFRGQEGRYQLIDDFVAASEQRIMQVREEGGQLVYSTLGGRQVLARPLAGK